MMTTSSFFLCGIENDNSFISNNTGSVEAAAVDGGAATIGAAPDSIFRFFVAGS